MKFKLFYSWGGQLDELQKLHTGGNLGNSLVLLQ